MGAGGDQRRRAVVPGAALDRAAADSMTALARFLDSYYRLRPVNATFTGVHDYDDRLPDWSPDGLAGAIDEMRHLRASLRDDRAASPDLRETGPRDVALAVSFLDIQIAELDSLHFQRGNPSLSIGDGVRDEWRRKALKECDGAQRVVGDGVRRWLALESLSDDRVRPVADRAGAAIDEFKRWLTADCGDGGCDRYAVGADFLDLLIER